MAILLVVSPPCDEGWGQTRGVKIVGLGGETLVNYQASYALVVGMSQYTSGWDILDSVPGELQEVEKILKTQGFHVEKHLNLTGTSLKRSFENFINKYGYDSENRLLFFFSGHGFSWNERGYLIPVDGPEPEEDDNPGSAFFRTVLHMSQVLAWARQMTANHVLFLFDSCFSGTIFKERSHQDPTPPHIKNFLRKPVRYFITAGRAGETVPAKSVFTPAFVDAIQNQLGDQNDDGYISATELGVYLEAEVPKHTRQMPQFGKIKDVDLSGGDFVFVLDEEDSPGTLMVQTQPTNAVVWIGNQNKGRTPLVVEELTPQAITIRASYEGLPDVEQKVTIRGGKTTKVMLILNNMGNLNIRTSPPASVWFLDDEEKGITPATNIPVKVGEHRIKVVKPGYRSWEKTVQIKISKNVQVVARLIPVISSQNPSQVIRDKLKDGSLGPKMVFVEGGCYDMGSPQDEAFRDEDERQHQVCLKDFAIGQYETTFEEYDRFATATGRTKPEDEEWGRGKQPVINVSWFEAMAFAEWLYGETGQKYRLPTEAEWEHAARGGTHTPNWWDKESTLEYANFEGTGGRDMWRHQAAPVGSFPGNPFSLFDTAGNVWEWTCSRYSREFGGTELACAPINDHKQRVLRGGGWNSKLGQVRSAYRGRNTPDYQKWYIGFRLAREITSYIRK